MRPRCPSWAIKYFVLFAAVIVTSSVPNKAPGDYPPLSCSDFYLTLIRSKQPDAALLRQKGALLWPGKPHLKWLNQSLSPARRQGACHQPVSPHLAPQCWLISTSLIPRTDEWQKERYFWSCQANFFLQRVFIFFAWLIKDAVICFTLQPRWLGLPLPTPSLQQS